MAKEGTRARMFAEERQRLLWPNLTSLFTRDWQKMWPYELRLRSGPSTGFLLALGTHGWHPRRPSTKLL